ncbi:class I SAM-dependent methyltransferase [Kribbella sancticallisti]|uniref:Class I SAM-dependent methyltransferase n=1 Tax=Kribbella sancticallisti TaxID=460087 RepID=A0ABN2EWP0_9ACTN
MDAEVAANRVAWEKASQKHVDEYDELLAEAAERKSLTQRELELLQPVLAGAPLVVHLQSGHGLDDFALLDRGARHVVGVDYSVTAATAAHRRARQLEVGTAYVVAEVPVVPLKEGCAGLVYTGKGALIWMRDLEAWAHEVARLLEPEGRLFVYEAHPTVPLWSWDEDEPRIRPDRGYFARSHINDSFPANGAQEWQWSLGEIVTAVVRAGLEIETLEEYAEPFWRPGGVQAAAWQGRLPNSFALLARRKS